MPFLLSCCYLLLGFFLLYISLPPINQVSYFFFQVILSPCFICVCFIVSQPYVRAVQINKIKLNLERSRMTWAGRQFLSLPPPGRAAHLRGARTPCSSPYSLSVARTSSSTSSSSLLSDPVTWLTRLPPKLLHSTSASCWGSKNTLHPITPLIFWHKNRRKNVFKIPNCILKLLIPLVWYWCITH